MRCFASWRVKTHFFFFFQPECLVQGLVVVEEEGLFFVASSSLEAYAQITDW